jgi:hypothetical protein
MNVRRTPQRQDRNANQHSTGCSDSIHRLFAEQLLGLIQCGCTSYYWRNVIMGYVEPIKIGKDMRRHSPALPQLVNQEIPGLSACTPIGR